MTRPISYFFEFSLFPTCLNYEKIHNFIQGKSVFHLLVETKWNTFGLYITSSINMISAWITYRFAVTVVMTMKTATPLIPRWGEQMSQTAPHYKQLSLSFLPQKLTIIVIDNEQPSRIMLSRKTLKYCNVILGHIAHLYLPETKKI